MLRLAQTQIGIGSRDLTWHTERHRSRQKLRENGYPIEVFGSPVKVRPGSAGKSRPSFAYGFPRPPSAEKVVRKDGFAQKDAVISNAPILQSLRTDWDNVVDDAGSPSGILIEHVGKRHQAIQRSRVSRETARSFSASVEDNVSDDQSIRRTSSF